MSKAPFMPVFTDALISDTTHLSAQEFGAYLLILLTTWRNNGVPLADNDVRLARVCRVSLRVWRQHTRAALVPFFDIRDGSWRQMRLQKEYSKTQLRISQRVDAANSRWLKTKETEYAAASQPHMESIPIPIKKEDTLAKANGADAPSFDPVKEIFDRGLRILGQAQRSLLGKLRKQHGDIAVLEAICACETEHPSDPAPFLIRSCKAHSAPKRKSPSTTLWEGAYNAAQNYIRDHGIDRDDNLPAQPLLDSGRPPRIA
jgi:uncharacterized protein YdaU (DUF1376 family)